MDISFITSLSLSGLLGAIIGLEREFRSKEAGLRTHFLVAVGSTLIMLVSKYGFTDIIQNDNIVLDPSRIAAQVVSGIGFLGAGTIIIQKQFVRGLTTAAGIWATSGIGLTIGAGMYTIGISATIFVLIGLEILSRVFKNSLHHIFSVKLKSNSKASIETVIDWFESNNIEITSYDCSEYLEENKTLYSFEIKGKLKREKDKRKIYKAIQACPDIQTIRIE
ncbi:MgtC/SapB family protein [Peribacillus loiseleuriae]|uniref:Methyltransferase n=1 Tax=Peribacillus loiseleuriae TaxID=1679170 RepID=A0A0K9GTS4_9BACI|nr:MgtC/SapB family protein [Peribacillus loiseleuriae]KMY49677.1 methyltransferase [Peribacillus loiseleuriae]